MRCPRNCDICGGEYRRDANCLNPWGWGGGFCPGDYGLRRKAIVAKLVNGEEVEGLHPNSRLRIEAQLLIEYARQGPPPTRTDPRTSQSSTERPRRSRSRRQGEGDGDQQSLPPAGPSASSTNPRPSVAPPREPEEEPE